VGSTGAIGNLMKRRSVAVSKFAIELITSQAILAWAEGQNDVKKGG
jgi:hypothetical protein